MEKNRPAKGTYVVLINGMLNEFDPEIHEGSVFGSYWEAEEYVHKMQDGYGDNDYYICSIVTLHHCTVQRHVREMGG